MLQSLSHEQGASGSGMPLTLSDHRCPVRMSGGHGYQARNIATTSCLRRLCASAALLRLDAIAVRSCERRERETEKEREVRCGKRESGAAREMGREGLTAAEAGELACIRINVATW